MTKTHALEARAIAGFVRGLSVRDVEAALTDALGPEAALSKSTVSRVCPEIEGQFQAWQQRRLDEVALDYLFLGGSHFKYHANAAAEPVLAAWGITTEGKSVFVGLDAAPPSPVTLGRGSSPIWVGGACAARCWSSATARPGCWPRSSAPFRPRCVKGVLFTGRGTSWPRSPRTPRLRSRPITGRSSMCPRPSSPARMRSRSSRPYRPLRPPLAGLLPRCGALSARRSRLADRLPPLSPFIERTFGETRRRVKVIGRLPGEHSCLSLVWAVLDRASRGWRGFTMTAAGLRQLQDLRRQLLEPPPSLHRNSPLGENTVPGRGTPVA